MSNSNLAKSDSLRKQRSLYTPLLRVGFALGIAFLLCQFQFDYIESLLYDGRVRLKPTSPTSGLISTIAVDSHTIDTLHHAPVATEHTEFLKKLAAGQPKVIVYLLPPAELAGSEDELRAFAKVANEIPNFFVLVNDVAQKGEQEKLRQPPPFENLVTMAGPTTTDRNLFAKDEVTRRMFVSYQGQVTLHQAVGSMFNPDIVNEDNINGLFNFLDSNQTYIDFRPTGTYPMISFEHVRSGKFDSASLKDKIVLVGRDIQTTSKDYIRTPFSRDIVAMTTLEMHANMLDTMILNSSPIRPPDWINLLLTGLISILTVYVVLTVKPTRGLFILASAILMFSVFSFLTFWLLHTAIGMAHPFLSIFICYYFFIPYRLIMENRRSWEYFQKNRLLTQVEELKTNFLSMMSHDLKTPIARIQGMTDIVLHDTNPLSDRQREALLTLEKSSEELLEFVSSILNLGRIESKEIKLHLQSKDPNTLLKETINKFEYMARQKGIQITAEFEPMFSVKMDVDLIRQVFSNLVENAIKYSPEKSRVLISTEEVNGRIVIQVADQGMGIPESEIGHVFLKFYRSKGAKTSSIKGSGLGLYLAKYFVELHNGKIFVDSAPGQGSTFTVELPMEPTA